MSESNSPGGQPITPDRLTIPAPPPETPQDRADLRVRRRKSRRHRRFEKSARTLYMAAAAIVIVVLSFVLWHWLVGSMDH